MRLTRSPWTAGTAHACESYQTHCDLIGHYLAAFLGTFRLLAASGGNNVTGATAQIVSRQLSCHTQRSTASSQAEQKHLHEARRRNLHRQRRGKLRAAFQASGAHSRRAAKPTPRMSRTHSTRPCSATTMLLDATSINISEQGSLSKLRPGTMAKRVAECCRPDQQCTASNLLQSPG